MTKRKNVLVVDDDPVFKLIARKLFERTGDFFEVTFAENGLEAIDLLRTTIEGKMKPPPDIILLDIEMPIMNGWGFMEEFVKLPVEDTRDISVYTVSSSIAQEDKNKKNGPFKKGIFVDSIELDENDKWTKYYRQNAERYPEI